MGEDRDKLCQEEVMKGECSLGFKNYNNISTIYWSFNMDKADCYPIPPSL